MSSRVDFNIRAHVPDWNSTDDKGYVKNVTFEILNPEIPGKNATLKHAR